MKIFGGFQDNAATYYRVTAPLSVVRYRTTHTVQVGNLTPDLADNWDVLWLHQYADPTTELIVHEFAQQGGRVVYDVDDWLFGLPGSWPCYDRYFLRGAGQPRDRLLFHERIVRRANVITCPTAYLARMLEEHLELGQGTVQVLPNCVVMGDWDVVPATAHDLEGPVLGWFGTENHWDDWAEIVPAVNEALRAVDGHLALIGAPEVITLFPDELAARTRVHPLVRMRDFGQIRELIKSFDVGLAWCTNVTQASRCRSPLKAIQYGAAGVPVVASQTVYEALDDFVGHMAVDTNQLTEHLIEALTESQDPGSATQEHAQEWQANVWGAHSYEIQAMRWLKVLGCS